jgi:hypothetical protein
MDSIKLSGKGNIHPGKPNASYKIFRHKKSGEYSYSTSSLGSDYILLKKEYANGDSAYARVIDLNKRKKAK